MSGGKELRVNGTPYRIESLDAYRTELLDGVLIRKGKNHMIPQEISDMFNFHFEKTSAEIIEKAKPKVSQLNAKIIERQGRIAALREEHGIDDGALIQLLTEARRHAQQRVYAQNYTYTTSSGGRGGAGQDGGKLEEKTIGAGVVNNLLTESDHIESERASVRQLESIIRNLRPLTRVAQNTGIAYTVDTNELTFDELKFLGF